MALKQFQEFLMEIRNLVLTNSEKQHILKLSCGSEATTERRATRMWVSF